MATILGGLRANRKEPNYFLFADDSFETHNYQYTTNLNTFGFL